MSFEFLKYASKIISFEIGLLRITPQNIEHILEFVAHHQTLTTFTFRHYKGLINMRENEFLELFEDIMNAVSKNPSIRNVNLFIQISNFNLIQTRFFKAFADRCGVVFGRGLKLNGIAIEKMMVLCHSEEYILETLSLGSAYD